MFIIIYHTSCCQLQVCPNIQPKKLNDTAASCNTELSRTYALLHPDERGQTFSQLFIRQVSRRHLKTLQEFQFAHLVRSIQTHHTFLPQLRD